MSVWVSDRRRSATGQDTRHSVGDIRAEDGAHVVVAVELEEGRGGLARCGGGGENVGGGGGLVLGGGLNDFVGVLNPLDEGAGDNFTLRSHEHERLGFGELLGCE